MSRGLCKEVRESMTWRQRLLNWVRSPLIRILVRRDSSTRFIQRQGPCVPVERMRSRMSTGVRLTETQAIGLAAWALEALAAQRQAAGTLDEDQVAAESTALMVQQVLGARGVSVRAAGYAEQQPRRIGIPDRSSAEEL